MDEIYVKYKDLEIKCSKDSLSQVNNFVIRLMESYNQNDSNYNHSNINNIIDDCINNIKSFSVCECDNEIGVVKTNSEEVDMKILKDNIRLPNTTSDFMCPNCNQGFIIKNLKNNKLYYRDIIDNTSTIRLLEVVDIVDIDYSIQETIDLYNNLRKYATDNVVFVSDDTSMCKCPVCKEEYELSYWIKHHNNNDEDKCIICGGEIDYFINEDGSLSCNCTGRCKEDNGQG